MNTDININTDADTDGLEKYKSTINLLEDITQYIIKHLLNIPAEQSKYEIKTKNQIYFVSKLDIKANFIDSNINAELKELVKILNNLVGNGMRINAYMWIHGVSVEIWRNKEN